MYKSKLAGIVLLALAHSAGAQGTLEIRTIDHTSGATGKLLIQAKGENLAMENQPGSQNADEAMAMAFNAVERHLLMMDVTKLTYMVLDETLGGQVQEEMNDMAQQMAEQMGGLPAQVLERMPPEARKELEDAMEKMRSGRAGSIRPPSRTEIPDGLATETAPLIRTADRGRASGVACRWYEREEQDGTKERYCAARARDVEGGGDILRGMRAMIAFYGDILDSFGPGMKDHPLASTPFMATKSLLEEDLLPIITEELRNGRIIESSELVRSSSDDVPDSAFGPRDGFTREDGFARGTAGARNR